LHIAHPDTDNIVLSRVSSDGTIAWVLSGDALDSTHYNERVSDMDLDPMQGLAAIAGSTDDAMFGCRTGQLAVPCMSSFLALAQFENPSSPPFVLAKAHIGGHGLQTTATSVTVSGIGATVMAGSTQRLEDLGNLIFGSNTNTLIGPNVSLTVNMEANETAWLASYNQHSGELRAEWVVTFVSVGDGHVVVHAVAEAGGDVVVVGEAPVSGLKAARWTREKHESMGVHAPQWSRGSNAAGFVAVISQYGSINWVRFATATDGDSAFRALVVGPGHIMAACSASPASTALYFDGHIVAHTRQATTFVLELAPDGAMASFTAVGSSNNVNGDQKRDEIVDLTDSPDGDLVLLFNTRGGELLSLSQSSGVAASLGGAAAAPSVPAVSSWDHVLVGIDIPQQHGFLKSLPRHLHMRQFLSASRPIDGSGVASGTSVGARRIMWVGSFTGSIAVGVDDISGSQTSTEQAGASSTDAIAVLYPTALHDVSAPVVIRLGGLPSGANDLFAAAAASNDVHFIVGDASVETGTVLLCGDLSIALPGGGGRDGFVVAVDDRTAAPLWMATLGGLEGHDDSLTAVATDDLLVAMAGTASGAAPQHGGSVTFAGNIAQRQLAVVYVSSTDGDELWARGFGTVATDGVADATAVAVAPRTYDNLQGVVLAGSFEGGALAVGETLLEPPAGSTGRTAFVVYMSAADGLVLWATRCTTGTATSSDYSIVTAVMASADAVAVGGAFLHAKTGSATWAAEGQSPPVHEGEGGASFENGFITMMARSSGDVVGAVTPSCVDDGCRFVALSRSTHGRSVAVLQYAGATRVGRFSLHSPNSTRRAAAVVLGGVAGSNIETVVRIGAGRDGDVVGLTVAVGVSRALVSVAGFALQGVSLPDATCLENSGCTIKSVQSFPSNETTPLRPLPFSVVIDAAPRAAMVRPTTDRVDHLVTLRSTSNTQPLEAVVPSRVFAALGRTSSITVANVFNCSILNIVSGSAHATSDRAVEAVIVGSDRSSGKPTWTRNIVASGGALDERLVVASVASSADGATICVVGSVGNFGGNNTFPPDWQEVRVPHHSVSDHPAGFVACLEDGSNGTPNWVARVGPVGTSAATAAAASTSHVFVAALHAEAGQSFQHSGQVSDSRRLKYAPTCSVWAVSLDSGNTTATGVQAGGLSSPSMCRISSLVVSADSSRLCIAGGFVGPTLQLAAFSTLAGSSATTSFVACYSLPLLSTASLMWTSTLVGESGTPQPQLPIVSWGHVTGQLLVTGLYFETQAMWGEADIHQGVSSKTLSALEAATVYIASFKRPEVGNEPETGVQPTWVANVASAVTDGVVASGGAVAGSDGAVALAVVASAPLVADGIPTGVVPPHEPATAHPRSFAAALQFDAVHGVAVRAHTLGDSMPRPAAGSQMAGVTIATSPVGAPVSGASDVVVVGAARGLVVSSRNRVPFAGIGRGASAGTDGELMLFQAAMGLSASSSAGAGVQFPDAASVAVSDARTPSSEDGNGHFAMQLEIRRTTGNGAITAGAWQSSGGGGVAFSLTADSVQAQLQRPSMWVTVESTAASLMPGPERFGDVVGQNGLHTLQLTTASTVIDPSSLFEVRNVRLVPRTTMCVPCGQVPVNVAESTVEHSGYVHGLPAFAPPSRASVGVAAVDASTLVDPSCNCLRGAQLVWQQWSSSGTPAVIGVALVSKTGDAGVVSLSPPDVSDTSDGWQLATATIRLSDHVDSMNMDWGAIDVVQLLLQANWTAPFRVRGVVLRRPCPLTPAALHPDPVELNSSYAVNRAHLGLTRGQSYRVITYETNMWGDASAPTCSSTFIADDTPPFVSNVTVLDLEPVPDAAPVDISFTRHATLSLRWTGVFEEPDSAPDNVLLFTIAKIARGNPLGPLVAGVTADTKLLPKVSDGEVSAGVVALNDGEIYYPYLGVCNVRM